MVKRTVVNKPESYPWIDWPAGRLLLSPIAPDGDVPAREKFTPFVIENLSKNDVLSLSLFYDAKDTWDLQELPSYADTLDLIAEIGPRVGGIMIGQELGVELSFRYRFDHWLGSDPRPGYCNMEMCADFIKRVGGLLRDRGAVPFFAPMDWEILQDVYRGRGMMRDALNSVGGTAYVACAYTIVPDCFIKNHPILIGEHLQVQRRWSKQSDNFPKLRAYLKSGSFWAGLGGIDGIRGGNIEKLSDYGFSGFSTKMPTQEIIDALEAERGPGWWN